MTIQELTILRKERGIQQKQIADHLKVSKSYLSNIESGKKLANESFFMKYFNAINELSPTIPADDVENLVAQLLKNCYNTERLTIENSYEALGLLAKVKGNPVLEATIYVSLSIIYRSGAIREYDTAIMYAQKAIDFYRSNQARYKVEYAEAMFELALIYMRTDKQVVAEEIFKIVNDVLELTEPDHMFRYVSLGNVAMIASNFGRELEALHFLKVTEQLAPAVRWFGYKWDLKIGKMYYFQMQLVYCYTKANIAESNEKYEEAVSEYIKSLKLMRESSEYIGSRIRELHTLDYIGNLYIKLGDYAKAEKYLLESISEKEKYPISHPSLYLEALNYLTKCYIHTQKFELAIKYAWKILDYDSNEIIPKAIAYRNIGRVYNLKDANRVAYRDYLNKAIEVVTQHEAYHKLELYNELIAERLSINTDEIQNARD